LGHIGEVTEERLQFVKQLGVDDVLVTPGEHTTYTANIDSEPEPTLSTEGSLSFEELVVLRNRVEDAGLRLFGLESLPHGLIDLMIGEKSREEYLECMKTSVRNAGRAGIDVVGYSGPSPYGVWKTSRSTRVRGNARAAAFDASQLENAPAAEDPYTEDEFWEAYEEFLEEILPVAEENGVAICLHPNDPPVEEIGGYPMPFRSFERVRHAIELLPSDNHQLKLGMGCFSEMGEDIHEVIRYFGGDKIAYIHFRDVVGTLPEYYETFLDDEESNYDEYEVIQTLQEVGFTGVLTCDHVPLMGDEEDWLCGGYRGRAYTVGYIKGMLKALYSET
jgi:mannonate dehydratase